MSDSPAPADPAPPASQPAPAPAPVAPAPSEPRTPLPLRVLSWALRAALVLGILACGYALLDLYRHLFTDPGGGPPVVEVEADRPEPAGADLRELLLGDGTWTAGGAGWAARVRPATPEELARADRAVGAPVPPERPKSDLERELLEWAKGGLDRAPLAAAPNCFTYTADLPDLRVRVVTEEVDGAERLRLGQAVFGAGENATLMEFTPAPAEDRNAEPLLPLPPGTTVQARRWSGSRMTAELVGPWAADAALPANWEAAGWVGKPLPGAVGAGPGAAHELRRGNEVLWVWRFGLPGGDGSLMVARPPTKGR